jgi:hypothetical protein
MGQRYADENAKIDGAVFPLKDRKHDKMPESTGILEFSKSMLKAMVEEMKSGHDPVRIRIAVWPQQEGKNPPHNEYRFVKLELLYPKDDAPAPEKEDDDESMPW